MSEKAKWKQALQSSNILLEFEAARLLSAAGFIVESDYKYARRSSDFVSESSIDLYAASVLPPAESAEEIDGRIELLVECVHGRSGANWLFMPEPGASDTPGIDSGVVIRVMDQFSSHALTHTAAESFDATLPICHKGFEIDMATGEVSEEEFRQGIEKLQFVLPRLITDNVIHFLTVRPERNLPFMICPILLTTVDLFVIKSDVTADIIDAASDFRDVADPVPCVAMRCGFGPGFEYQCGQESKRMRAIQRTDNAALVEQKRARRFGSRVNLPFTVMEALISGDKRYLSTYFTRFVVCNHRHFPELVDTIKQTAATVSETRQWID